MALLHLGPTVITFRTSLHLGQLLHLGLQHTSRMSWRGIILKLCDNAFLNIILLISDKMRSLS